MIQQQVLSATIDEIKNSLKCMAYSGCRGFDCSKATIDIISKWGTRIGPETMAKIRIDLGECKRCKLSRTRKNIVFGAGDPDARLVFVGESPGYEEDKSGKPFVGPAGQLLTKIIRSINLSREQVYICNIIKCRPPGNRNPETDEIETCFPFLKRQLAVIKPDFICTLGTFAGQTLLDTDVQISKLRGRFHRFGDIKLMPTYHPAYLLRNPEKKRDVWEDMKQLMKAMGTV
jgi:uracil-DNA glycosylase